MVIKFSNLNKKKIYTKFRINDSPEYFETNSGEIKIPYQELEDNLVLGQNGRINRFTFYFKDNEYVKDMKEYQDSRNPNVLDIKLNEFKGKEFAFLNREFNVNNDSILMNGISVKTIGSNNRYLIKE